MIDAEGWRVGIALTGLSVRLEIGKLGFKVNGEHLPRVPRDDVEYSWLTMLDSGLHPGQVQYTKHTCIAVFSRPPAQLPAILGERRSPCSRSGCNGGLRPEMVLLWGCARRAREGGLEMAQSGASA